ncbi:MAG: preprotein translocase subunit YajC [Fibrobacterota bacterium]
MIKRMIPLFVTAASAWAEGGLKDPTGGAQTMNTYIMLGLIMVGMWFFLIRPEQKKQKKAQAMRESLKKGDRIITAGGIFGTIKKVQDDRVTIHTGGNTEFTILKSSVGTLQSDESAVEKK